MREKLIELLRECLHFNYDEFSCEMSLDVDLTAENLIAHGVTVQQWIPVTERLPEKDGIYFTCNKKKEYEFHFFQTGKRMWPAVWEEDGVTHWMPLPQPPKGE